MIDLESKIERITETGCWIWTGPIAYDGYGKFGAQQAHRFVYETLISRIPDGLYALHRCDVRCCVNPNHIFIGNQSDNMSDMWKKNRGRKKWRKSIGYKKYGIDLSKFRHLC